METMNASSVYITHHDERKLRKLIDEYSRENTSGKELPALIDKIEEATIVDSHKMPRNVVTLNSRVAVVNLDTFERLTFSLVLPEDSRRDPKGLSVLDPNHLRLLGRHVGDKFEWSTPGGTQRFVIAKIVYQPEAWEYHKRDLSIVPSW